MIRLRSLIEFFNLRICKRRERVNGDGGENLTTLQKKKKNDEKDAGDDDDNGVDDDDDEAG